MLKVSFYNKGDSIEKVFEDRVIATPAQIEEDVDRIIENTKLNGDVALKEYSKLFDGIDIEDFIITRKELQLAARKVSREVLNALKKAKENIEKFHVKQKQNSYVNFEEDGVFLGQRVLAIENVGVYVPGGIAAYPSSVLMNVIPAKVAGVKNIIMVTPPSKTGRINPVIAAAAIIADIDCVYSIGGAQAIAALAFGTKSIPKVDKIVGPGNIYVATAKKKLYGVVDIDMIAGPSEILVIADEGANPKYIAADLLSQAEHDKMAASILVTTSESLCEEVNLEIENQLKVLDRKEIIQHSLENYSKAIICESIDDAINVANEFAPEHLELMIQNPMEHFEKVKNAASVFLGYYTPEPVGDYFAGVNHVLPTNSTARFFSPLSVDSFIKKMSFTYYTKDAINKNGKDIMLIAEKEGLLAHKNSIKVRMEK
ncbi:histidinol dehydrogenase [uncultured Clostridium sp.]|jgi:histidinol dehydrogenase|uniref:histidinol dehydrogenase n=1 Tax=uncultured Clostridium sp. TaxID=59620 RepID=UPI002606A06F|nr:histidinol dehydrogenase [uncultured Clostridium sp.]